MSDLLSSLQIGSGRRRIASLVAVGVAVIVVAGIAFPDSIAGILLSIVTSKSALSSTLRLSVPIAFAALGGIFAEKSGVINIGLEGHLIIAAFVAIYGTNLTGSIWLGFVAGVLASTLLAGLFAVICIEFRADQIIAGLAVWLVALGLAPFLSTVIYGSVNVSSSGSFQPISPAMLSNIPILGRVFSAMSVLSTIPIIGPMIEAIPVLSEIPFFGALFDATFPVYLLFVAVALSWYILNRTAFGRWVNASGENPEALATVGVSVRWVRYVSVLLSGVLAGMGGASFSISLSQFVGNGQTMIGGRGFIAIVAYLFGNYNPVGAFFSTTLFAGLQALQIRLQSVPGYAVPDSLIQTIPYITVIVVLAFVGRTRIPSAAGEHYESGED